MKKILTLISISAAVMLFGCKPAELDVPQEQQEEENLVLVENNEDNTKGENPEDATEGIPEESEGQEEGDRASTNPDVWEPRVKAKGGSVKYTALYLDSWGIRCGYEDTWDEDGEVQYSNYVCASAQDETAGDYIDGGWYSAIVPKKGSNRGNQLLITVKPNKTYQPRHAFIEMESDKDSPIIKIIQDPAIQLDMTVVHFPAEGGEETVTVLNYDSWEIGCGFHSFVLIGDQEQYQDYVEATSSGDGVNNVLEGGWYRCYVPSDGSQNSNQLVITVKPNETDQSHSAVIKMWMGDVYTAIRIDQVNKNGRFLGTGPIQPDKQEVIFPHEGGEETVTALNYSGWWIACGYDDVLNENGEVHYSNYVRPLRYDTGGLVDEDFIDGGWYSAIVPKDGIYCSNRLVITVKPNETGQPHQAFIVMEAVDIFTTIKIVQP